MKEERHLIVLDKKLQKQLKDWNLTSEQLAIIVKNSMGIIRISGNSGPTGKTSLTDFLNTIGLKAIELDYFKDKIEILVDHKDIIILNDIIPIRKHRQYQWWKKYIK